jgi:hypothetical protein
MVLDDGELDDIQSMLEEMHVPFGRVRGGAIVEGTPPPSDLLISTPRRIDAVDTLTCAEAMPLRVVVTSEDSIAMREQLRRIGFDYLVRRPVHPEALRLLLLHCLYKGDERRTDRRVPVGLDISFKAGLLSRRAMLADLSARGCRLLSRTRIEPGKRIRVQVPGEAAGGEPLTLTGRALRSHMDDTSNIEPVYSVGVLFDPMDEAPRKALLAVIEARALGPATLDGKGSEVAGEDPTMSPLDVNATLGLEEASRVELEVDVGLESEPGEARAEAPAAEAPETEASNGKQADDRRHGPRAAYEQTVPAFGKRALRVLVGRDLSLGGMRIEPLPGLELGDRLHLAIYGNPGEAPFLVWATVARDDGDQGLGLVFDPVESALAERLEGLVGGLPAVEDLHDSECEAMGTVVSEILER